MSSQSQRAHDRWRKGSHVLILLLDCCVCLVVLFCLYLDTYLSPSQADLSSSGGGEGVGEEGREEENGAEGISDVRVVGIQPLQQLGL